MQKKCSCVTKMQQTCTAHFPARPTKCRFEQDALGLQRYLERQSARGLELGRGWSLGGASIKVPRSECEQTAQYTKTVKYDFVHCLRFYKGGKTRFGKKPVSTALMIVSINIYIYIHIYL